MVSDDELDHILASITDGTQEDSDLDPLIQFVVEDLGGVVCTEPIPDRAFLKSHPQLDRQHRYVSQYLETHSYASQEHLSKTIPRLLTLIREGKWDDVEEVKKVAGILEEHFLNSEAMKKRLCAQVASWLKQKKIITDDNVGDVAHRVIDLSLMAFDRIPLQIDIFEGMRVTQKENLARHIQANPVQSNPQAKKKRKKKTRIDLLAVPDDSSEPKNASPVLESEPDKPLQLTLFS